MFRSGISLSLVGKDFERAFGVTRLTHGAPEKAHGIEIRSFYVLAGRTKHDLVRALCASKRHRVFRVLHGGKRVVLFRDGVGGYSARRKSLLHRARFGYPCRGIGGSSRNYYKVNVAS